MKMAVDRNAGLSIARDRAASFESKLDPDKRKRLGQFFTGLPLSRILAALSVPKNCTSVIDPMAGHGDLLDAVFERCTLEGIRLSRIDAIEVAEETAKACLERLKPWREEHHAVDIAAHESSAFDSALIDSLPAEGYDLVITNPPYVRYQTFTNKGSLGNGDSLERIRKNLLQIVSDRIPQSEQSIWRELVQGFSGLSDLSVPSWLLAAMLVKTGGVLALVAPATWRNRNYADVLQYLLARCFKLEAIISDRQPGWFSKVLVRTNLVVAIRLPSKAILPPLCLRNAGGNKVVSVEVDKIAKEGESLVGAAFPGEDPERYFAQWVLHKVTKIAQEPKGITVMKRQEDVLSWVRSVRQSSSWLERLEPSSKHTPLFSSLTKSSRKWIPHELKKILPSDCEVNLHELSKIGIEVGQGLRTGCNVFFYVEMVKQIDDKTARIRISNILGGDEIDVPMDALKPVLKRQAEIDVFISGSMTPGYVLDLREYVLPEDLNQVQEALNLYKASGTSPPKAMPKTLVDIVNRAAKTKYGSSRGGKYIPELSAVKTNTRASTSGSKDKFPRFWYMLPDFQRRHIPEAFVPRVNQHTPRILQNRVPPLLIDANFSTLWANGKSWSPEGIVGIMNSSWVRACMEAIGTPMGGGALKLEATHLRRLPVPKLSNSEIEKISEIATNSHPNHSSEVQNKIDNIMIKAILGGHHDDNQINHIIGKLHDLTRRLSQARQRV